MTGRYAKDTTVSVEATRAEIETIVRKYGADSFMSGYDPAKAMVQFRAHDRFVKFVLTLPDRQDKAYTEYTLGHGNLHTRSTEAAHKLWEQACRSKWRALLLLVKAKLEAVEVGIATFESEFLANVVMPDGSTVYEQIKEKVAITYQTGNFQPLLPGPK